MLPFPCLIGVKTVTAFLIPDEYTSYVILLEEKAMAILVTLLEQEIGFENVVMGSELPTGVSSREHRNVVLMIPTFTFVVVSVIGFRTVLIDYGFAG